jgi:hypothetical protein
MAKNSVLIIALYIAINIIAFNNGEKMPCNRKSNKAIDKITPKILNYGNSGRKFPETAQQLDSYCA